MKRKIKYPIEELLKPLGEKKWQGNVYGARFDGQIIMNVEKETGPVPSPSPTPSVTPSISITPIPSVTPSVTPSETPSVTPSETPSVTPSITPTPTPSITSTPSVTPSITPTPSLTPTPSVCPDWTPSNISTYMWFDASDSATITESGGRISQWDDKSGNGRHATQTDANEQPLTGATFNGLDTIFFDSNAGYREFNIPKTSGLTNFSLYVVAQKTGREDNYSVVFSLTDATNATFAGFSISWGMSGVNEIIYYSNTEHNSNTELNQNQYYISSVLRDTAAPDINFWLNGADDGTGITINNANAFTNSFIGNDDYNSYFNGNIGEIIFVDSYQSDSDRQKVEGYLAWKWGLEGDLPAGHPYENAPPKSC